MTSANKDPESSATNEPEKKEDTKQSKGEAALDPNPAQALTDLVTGSEADTSKDKPA